MDSKLAFEGDWVLHRAERFVKVLRAIYSPKYLMLNLFLGIAEYAVFIYLASVQGGGAVMLHTEWYFIFSLIATSSLLLTIATYSVFNKAGRNFGVNGTTCSATTVVVGSGLCGCTTTFSSAIAALFLGAGSPGVYQLSAFLKNYSPYIFSIMILANVFVILFMLEKFANLRRM
ncbi:MAG: hypothetical protein KGH53_03655 [Candidatus Micrarchaeota archaeon]|nr:hypothetical protein [Candidatus Micrarchaeota archaeon]